jgi:hypothetical protein
MLVLVEAQSATYLKARHGKAVTLFQVVKGAVTGARADVGTKGELNRAELRQGHESKKL